MDPHFAGLAARDAARDLQPLNPDAAARRFQRHRVDLRPHVAGLRSASPTSSQPSVSERDAIVVSRVELSGGRPQGLADARRAADDAGSVERGAGASAPQ